MYRGSPLIAAVSDSGLVTGLAEGSSSITAMASGITSEVSVIMVIIAPPPPAEAGMGGIVVLDLAFGALLMSQKKTSKEEPVGGKVERIMVVQ